MNAAALPKVGLVCRNPLKTRQKPQKTKKNSEKVHLFGIAKKARLGNQIVDIDTLLLYYLMQNMSIYFLQKCVL